MVIFRPGDLYSLCNPGNQDYQKIIPQIVEKLYSIYGKVVFLVELVVIIMNGDIIIYYRTLADFDLS